MSGIIICWVGWTSDIQYLCSDMDTKDYMNFLYHSPIAPLQASWWYHFGSLNCLSHILAYIPPRPISSLCVPFSTILPSSIVKIKSAWTIVLNRWAITTVVRPLHNSTNEPCIFRSVSLSRAAVASSNRMIFGFLRNTRANATLWRCPPLIWSPLWPTQVLYLSGSPLIQSWICAALAASSTSSAD